ncbi:MAG: hypothetical protein IJT65_05575, partial [Eubacterium sp.]|nr:hypothetical protein [Eubacterium sp.]
MKKMTKRCLSLVMSLIMVVTTIPVLSIGSLTAFAKNAEPSPYSYLTTGIDSAFTNTGSVSWDGTEKAARFNGSNYLQISDFDAFSNVSSSTGFAVSFDFKRDTTNSDYNFVLTLTNGSNANRFTFNAGSNTNDANRRGLTIGAVNGAYNWYNTELFGNSTYTTESGTGHGPWHPDDNTWYNVTLYMTPINGNTSNLLCYYVDGTLINKFKVPGNWGANAAGDTTNQALADAISGFTTLKIGAGAENGEKFSGYVRNVQFYSGAGEDTVKSLKTAMTAYETKMADASNIYTNLSTAYTKYQKASALYDSYIYGEASATTNASTYANAAIELATATNAMKPWTKPVANAAQSYQANALDGGVDRATSNSVNIISSNRNNTTGQTTAASQEIANCSTKVFYGENVLLYDGSIQPRFPVTFSCVRTSNKTRYVHTMYPASSDGEKASSNNASLDFDLHHDKDATHANCWYGSDTNNNRIDYGYNYTLSEKVGGNATNSDNHWSAKLNNSTTHYYVNAVRYIGTPDAAIKDFQIKWSQRSSANEQVYGTSITSDDYGTMTSSVHTYVYNYAGIKSKLEGKYLNGSAVRYNVADYKEGGLATLLGYIDALTVEPVSMINSASTANTAYSNIAGTTPTEDSNYKAIKNAIDNPGPTSTNSISTSVLNAYATKTGSGGANSGGYTIDSFGTFASAYESAVSTMAALANSLSTAYPTTSVASTATALNNGFNGLALVPISVPSFSQGEGTTSGAPQLVGVANNSLTITNNESGGTVNYTVTYGSGATVSDQFSSATTTIDIFDSNNASETTATVDAYTVKGGNNSGHTTAYFKNYKAPAVTSLAVARGATLASVLSSNNSEGTLQYSTDNASWNNAASYVPFPADSATESSITLYVREYKDANIYSPSNDYVFVRKGGDLTAYQEPANSKGEEYFDANATIKIPNASSYSGTVYYTLTKDGGDEESQQPYDKANGFTILSGNVVKVKAWAGNNTAQATETYLYNAATTNGALIYQESFKGASVSGNAFNTASTTGKTATATGTISVEKGAGTKTSSGKESHSWRNNVLKINANSTKPGPVVTLSSNPLSEDTNPAIINQNGVTIAFWRHIEDTSGNTVSLPSTGDWTGYPWRNAIAFQKNGDDGAYYIIEVNGVNSLRQDGSNYADFAPENEDNTGHEEGNNNGEWEHIAVTIHPTEGIKVYTNGVEHDVKRVHVVKNGSDAVNVSTTNHDAPLDTKAATAGYASDLLDFLTQSTTKMTFDNGVIYEGNEYNLFLDDIRVYSKALTQVNINNMYTDKHADVQTNISSTSHDPTTVTVYTLASAVGGKAAGAKVGQEFIDYYNVTDAQISNIEYYSFGTGMTIYKAGETVSTLTGDNQIRWEVLGDSKGRCGYQNEELFGEKYTSALADVRSYLGVDPTKTPVSDDKVYSGAGYLVWAPHVMYNLTLNKWVYYAAMSSWGATKSATFYATSDNPISGYTYQDIVYKSNTLHPNAIDSCVFYGHTGDGTPTNSAIDKNKLYMVIGSWGHAHNEGRFDAIYGVQLNANGSAAPNMKNTADSLEVPGTTFTGTNGTYTSYALVRGYTADLEADENGNGESQSSGEGAYVQYINGYYYLFVSYGQNEGSYTERVFRATTPMGTGGSGSFTEYAGTNGFQANDSTVIYKTRGNQLLAPFDSSVYTKIYRSTGHNSVFKAKNNDGESVYINSVHGRPYASETHSWTAVQDNALAKRQSGGVTGNVCLNNLVAITEHKWMVMFPYQYNGTDTIYKEITAKQLEGLYGGNNMRKKVDSNWGHEYQYTFLANEDPVNDPNHTTGCIFGVRGDDTEFRMKFKLVRDENGDKVQYIRIYNDSATYDEILADDDPTTQEANSAVAIHEGVIGIHNKAGKQVPMLATLDITNGANSGLQYWAYRKADVPDVDQVISHGNQVSMDDVIYTHASDKQVLAVATINRDNYANDAAYYAAQKTAYANAANIDTSGLTTDEINSARNAAYAVYGQEISDNYDYGHKDANDYYDTGGEKYTTFVTKYPNYIEMDKSYTPARSVMGSIVSLSDTEYCRAGKTGSNMYAVERNDGWWCTKDGNVYTKYSTDDNLTNKLSTDGHDTDWAKANLYKVYGLKGTVSDYFRYYDNEDDGSGTRRTGYPRVGVTLVLSYKDATDGNTYSEFEFCYVMPNPAWAHTLAAIKNDNKDVIGNDRNSSYGTFNRFLESSGTATSYYSNMLYYSNHTSNFIDGWGHGVSGYLTDFNTSATGKDLNTLDKIKTLYNFYGESIGVNSGSFSAQEHNDDCPNSYTATPDVVDVNYYIDYSDKDNYLSNNPNTGLIRTTNNNTTDVPVGYQFKMRTSNFLWENYSGAAIYDVTSYARNNTGITVTYSGTAANLANTTYTSHWYGDDDDDGDVSTQGGIVETNRSSFATNSTLSGKRDAWAADEMLFHSDSRKDSNALFGYSYRNRYLYHFTNGATPMITSSGSKNDDGWIDGNKDSAPQVYNYLGQIAYTTGSNGKADTNAWIGTATFTGKERVTPNTYSTVYDGYWYKHDTGRADDREDWAASLDGISGIKDSGQLDVSAENYANYILEMGSYHKVDDSIDGGRFLGKENYHYYNIGVATCDKGAARDFIDTFGLKILQEDANGKVVLDSNGRPTATADMQVEDMSAASYRDYLNALARLEWFVHNPQNTLQNDLVDEDTYDKIYEEAFGENTVPSTEYTTSYGNNGKAIYKADVTNTDIFGTGTTTTDKVQAQLIADVIEAYEHLYTVEDYKKVEKQYNETKQMLINAQTDIDAGKYTDSSVQTYSEDVDALLDSVKFYTNSNGSKDTATDPDLIDTS